MYICAMIDLVEQPFKKCLVCGNEYTRQLTNTGNIENWGDFKRRKYCSAQCRDKKRYLKEAKTEKIIFASEYKLCIACNKYFTKNIIRVEGKYPIRKECTNRFNARQHCSNACFKNSRNVSKKMKLSA